VLDPVSKNESIHVSKKEKVIVPFDKLYTMLAFPIRQTIDTLTGYEILPARYA